MFFAPRHLYWHVYSHPHASAADSAILPPPLWLPSDLGEDPDSYNWLGQRLLKLGHLTSEHYQGYSYELSQVDINEDGDGGDRLSISSAVFSVATRLFCRIYIECSRLWRL